MKLYCMIRCQAKGVRMRAIWLSLFHLFTFSPLAAQTVSSVYQPGVTTEGAIYFLPKTAVIVTVQVEKTTYTPGDFCQYAERFLRIKEVSPTPSVSYRIPMYVSLTTASYRLLIPRNEITQTTRNYNGGILLLPSSFLVPRTNPTLANI